MIEFAHLHCHTKYSIQDAIPNHKAYVDAIYEQNARNVMAYLLMENVVKKS